MRLTILGSGYFIPTQNRNTSGYLLQIGNESVLLDSGSGTIRQLAQAGHSFLHIKRIFYSHLHLDHIAEFLPILFSRKYAKPERPAGELTIHAHPTFGDYYRELTRLFEKWVIDPEYPTLFQPLTPGEYGFPGYSLKVFTSNHTPESLMYRFESEQVSFLYTGDVDLCADLYTAADHVDWLLIECGNLDDNPAPGHMNPTKIKQLLEKARPRHVILTHIPPELENLDIRQVFREHLSISIEMAADLKSYYLG
jgi:ribonuclease Z